MTLNSSSQPWTKGYQIDALLIGTGSQIPLLHRHRRMITCHHRLTTRSLRAIRRLQLKRRPCRRLQWIRRHVTTTARSRMFVRRRNQGRNGHQPADSTLYQPVRGQYPSLTAYHSTNVRCASKNQTISAIYLVGTFSVQREFCIPIFRFLLVSEITC